MNHYNFLYLKMSALINHILLGDSLFYNLYTCTRQKAALPSYLGSTLSRVSHSTRLTGNEDQPTFLEW